METAQERDERQQDTADPLPADTKQVRNHASNFSAPVARLPDDWLAAQGYDPDALDDSEIVYFEPGETIPLDLARQVWDGFGDLLDAENGNNTSITEEAEDRTQDERSADYRWQ